MFSNLFRCILLGGLSVTGLCFPMTLSKQFWVSDKEYDLSGNWNLSIHVEDDNLNV